ETAPARDDSTAPSLLLPRLRGSADCRWLPAVWRGLRRVRARHRRTTPSRVKEASVKTSSLGRYRPTCTVRADGRWSRCVTGAGGAEQQCLADGRDVSIATVSREYEAPPGSFARVVGCCDGTQDSAAARGRSHEQRRVAL